SVSQPVLTQPASLCASPGASARLSCTLSRGYSAGAREHPRYLLNFYSDYNKHQDSGVPCCFSGCKDASANAGRLLVSGLQP
ncbi:hypothetical protein FD755_025874, partial [Muntiacus reevesi]